MADDSNDKSFDMEELGRMLKKLRSAPSLPPEIHHINMLSQTLFGTSEWSFFRSMSFRFLDQGPLGKAFWLFVGAIRDKILVTDKKAALTVVSKDGSYLRYAAPDLRNDKEVYAAAGRLGSSLIGDTLADDRDFILSLPFCPPLSLLSARLRNDPDIVLKSGDLHEASTRLRDDEQLVRALIGKSTGDVLYHASERLRDDKDLVLYAISRERGRDIVDDKYLISCVSDRLKADADVIAATEENRRRRENCIVRKSYIQAYG